MNGKSWSIPFGMVFRRYHCAKCGTKLEKEKTHRVVTKEDKDYYQYQDYNKFPQRDYDVYGYRFKCPSCNARVSYDEQCVIKLIQKKQGTRVLSSGEVKSNYKECKAHHDQSVLIQNLLVPIVFGLVFFIPFYFLRTNRTSKDLIGIVLLFLAFSAFTVVGAIRRYKGKYKFKINGTYSYEKETQLERLHAYSVNNRRLIDVSNRCYCFYCKQSMYRGEIERYIDNGQTAICPRCQIDAIIPDSIEEAVDENIIAEMHEYWF